LRAAHYGHRDPKCPSQRNCAKCENEPREIEEISSI